MARDGKQACGTQEPEVVIVTTETPLFTTSITRYRYRITPNYVQGYLKAARFTIRDVEVESVPYEGRVYHATVDVYELLPGYVYRSDLGVIVPEGG